MKFCGLSIEEVQDIYSKVGSTYTLRIERDNKLVDIQIEIVKKTIDNVVANVYQENGKNIGYIKLNMFSFTSAEEFKNEFSKIKEKGFDSLIIDLRDNLGGENTNLIKIASLFLDNKKVICNEHYRNKTKAIYSKGKETAQYPIVILCNNNTASCSEILIGALIEGCDTKLIGTTTRGKGVGQRIIKSNSYEYKYTESSWTMPSGKSINQIGIKPDIEIENYNDEDKQLQKAIEYLKNLN